MSESNKSSIPVINLDFKNKKLAEAREKTEQAKALRAQIADIDIAARELEETAAVIFKIYGEPNFETQSAVDKVKQKTNKSQKIKRVVNKAAKKSAAKKNEATKADDSDIRKPKGKISKESAMRLMLTAVGKGYDTFPALKQGTQIPYSTARRALDQLVKSGKLKVVARPRKGAWKYSL